MHNPFRLALTGLLVSCLTQKDYLPNNSGNSGSERTEGTKQGDCSDELDNDGDGLVDCQDAGCVDKPVCEGFEDVDTGVDDTDEQDTDEQDTNNEDCSDYRSSYPSSGYGTSVGTVIADLPGMVDGNGNSRSLAEIYADTSKVALVIANAFDT